MSKQAKKGCVPMLRFPEFRDAGEWEESSLGETCERIIEKVGNRKLNTVSIAAGTGFVSQAEKFSRDISGKQYKNYILLKKGEYSYNKGNSKRFPQGCIYKLKEFDQVAAPNAFISFRFNNNYCGDFFQGYFDSNRHGEQLKKFISSGARSDGLLNINADDFFTIKFPTPSKIEQQKIADCLTSIDELITAQTQKITELKAHKKGLMQQLFPAEGETIPSLRFPEFWDVGEWEEKPIKKVFSIFQGYAFSSNDSVKTGVRWLKIADVNIQQMDNSSPSYLPIEHKEKYEKFSVTQGDYVIALTRPILSKQLKIAPVDSVFDGALLNQRVGKLVTSQNTAFVYYFLQTAQLINEIEKNIAGSEPPNLSAQQIENIKVYIPLEKEQQKIADCLSSIDELITAQNQKLDVLKVHKKGLMQQLFPAVDEVAG